MQAGDGQNQAGWTFRPEGDNGVVEPQQTAEPQNQPSQNQPPQETSVTWTASEFIASHKGGSWYASATGVVFLLCALVFFFTKDVISVITISIVFILFIVVSTSKPRQRSYTVDSRGVYIDNKFHPYGIFKSFDMVYEGAIGAINFLPLKRFMPELTIYFAPDDEQKIVDILTKSLPYDERKEHGIDRLMRRLRF